MAFLVAGSAVVLIRAGGTARSVPLGSTRELTGWLRDTAPPELAVGLLRLGALAICAYLAVAVLVTIIAGVAPDRRSVVALARLAPAAVRRAVLCSAGSGLATGVVLGSFGPYATSPVGAEPLSAQVPTDDPLPHTATMTNLGPRPTEAQTGATMTELAPGPEEPASSLPTPSPPATATATSTTTAPVAPPRPGASPTPPGDSDRRPAATEPSSDDEWIVGPGESFWSIAEEALRDARRGAQPTDEEIADYWHALIAANRDRLSAPDNPDLLHVGQPLRLPPPP